MLKDQFHAYSCSMFPSLSIILDIIEQLASTKIVVFQNAYFWQ